MSFWRQPGFWLNVLLVTVGGAIVLLLGQDTLRETAFTVLMFIALASSLNIIMGFAGYVNFGHIVFFGLGGYFGFFLLSELGWPLYISMIAGGCLSVVVALVVGAAVLRLRGAYFALATIGINEADRAFVANFGPFGGATGLYVNFSAYDKYGGAGPALWWIFTLLWLVAIATVVLSYLVKHSRFGLGLIAIREDEDAAMVMGVRAPWD
ncbi:MAG TPA: branched-chain amino acid ABC transporter permease, partial [Desulfobaccales bacterium]|nr:branched-chain amino acid ABC transporter permease [Desulfobaccales bacterium]